MERVGDVWCVRRGPDDAVPITQNGKPAQPIAGWRPVRVMTGIGPANVLELRHDNGETSSWFLNPDCSFKTNVLGNLPEAERDAFVAAVMQPVRAVWEQLIAAAAPTLDAATRDFLGLGAATLQDVVRLANKEPFPHARHVRLDDPNDAELFATDKRFTAGSTISVPIITDLFKRDFLRDAIRAASFSRLILPSPIDGRSLATDIALPLTPMTIAYKFTDTLHDVTFYAVASLWCATITAYYFPTFGLVVYGNLRDANHLADLLPKPLDAALFDHAIQFGSELETYLLAPRRTVTYLYFQDHLGHHLWNELTGLHAVVTELPKEQIPDILMISGPRSEMYGHVDLLFPELAGKVDRTPTYREALTRWGYANTRCLFNPTGEYVSADLARRIITLAERDPGLDAAKAEAARLAADGFVIVMLGLRVENRTVVDPAGFFTEITRMLREQCKRVAVVLDGHNSNAEQGSVYPSHAENLATQAPEQVEQALVQHVRNAFAGDPNVAVISTVGAPVTASVFWCRRAAFFVTPWGAGLAKYRWICNQRGLVVAGERFFHFAGHKTVHLYDLADYMEAPTPLDFISADEVKDDPEAPLLIGLRGDPNRVNFRVNMDAVRARLARLIEDIGLAA